MPMPQKQLYTEEGYYSLAEDIRAKLINGNIYYHAAPRRIHQTILGQLYTTIHNYIKLKGGSCKVYPVHLQLK